MSRNLKSPVEYGHEKYIYIRQDGKWAAVNTPILIWSWIFVYYGFQEPEEAVKQINVENDLASIYMRIIGDKRIIDVEVKPERVNCI